MVTIVASYNITPNQPTPSDPLWLSDIDHLVYLGHVPSIYVYKAKHNDNTIERLRNSLSKILAYYYPLAGRLILTESGRMEVDCNAKGVTLLEAETTNTLGDYGDFLPSESTKELVPKVDYTTQPIEELPLMLLQLTRFHDGEGFAIGLAMSHPLVDGRGAFRFINTWAKVARGEELDSNEMPFLDRTILKFPHQPSATSFDRTMIMMPTPLESKNIAEQKMMHLKLTSSQVERLKKKANDQGSKEGVKPYTRFEAISAHIWKCSSKARESGDNYQPTIAEFNADIRSRLIPPLPPSYFGNAFARAVTPKCYVGDIISKPLSYVAEKIRGAVNKVNDEYIRSQLSVILGQEHLDCIKAFFSGQESQLSTPRSGNHNVHITSWVSMPMDEADFGWGKPMHFGLVNEFREDMALISSSYGDGVIVYINFETISMQLFNKFFYDDL